MVLSFSEVWGAPTESELVIDYMAPTPNLDLISSYQYGVHSFSFFFFFLFLVNSIFIYTYL